MHGAISRVTWPDDDPRADVLDGFERMQCGGILLDEHGRVLHLNARARQHLGDGLTITGRRLTATCNSADRTLQSLITTALQPASKQSKRAGPVLAVPRPGARPLMVRVLRTLGDECCAFENTRAVVLILDPPERSPSAEALLQAVFCLTPAEARVALGVMCGDTLEEIAQAHQVRLGTVRVQMRAVFKKTQTSRQAELVMLLTYVVLPRISQTKECAPASKALSSTEERALACRAGARALGPPGTQG